jgi:hypothetical protein
MAITQMEGVILFMPEWGKLGDNALRVDSNAAQ